MMRLGGSDLQGAVARARELSPDYHLIDRQWAERQGASFLAQTSGTVIDDVLVKRFVEFLVRAEEQHITVVVHDPDMDSPFGFRCECRVDELAAAADATAGFGSVIMPTSKLIPAILVTAMDYRLVVGEPRSLANFTDSIEEDYADFLTLLEVPVLPEGRALYESIARTARRR